MAKRKQHTGETLEQIESAGDRLAEWISDHRILVLGTGLGILMIAGGYGFVSSARESAYAEASDALAVLQSEFRLAMGSDPEAIELAEPANPETAREVRREYGAKFRTMAAEHRGTVASALAWLEVGAIEEALGNSDMAVEVWTSAADELDSDELTRALLLSRVASVQERSERWLEAGVAYERAASVEGYPLRYSALAQAARCFAEAREVERAVAALESVETEAPDQVIFDHIRAQVAELQAASGS